MVAELLGIDQVGLADNFFHLGGHSLLATRLAAQIRRRLGRELPLRTIFDPPALGDLARALRTLPKAGRPLRRQPRPAVLPLSFAQARLWFLHQLEGAGANYNIAVGVRLKGALDTAALEAALADVVERHESLRTLLVDGAGGPQQRVMPVDPAVRPRPGIPSSPQQLEQDVAAAAPDRAALEGALADGLEQHESQRTLLVDGAGSPQQRVMPVDPAVPPRPGIPSSAQQLEQDVAAAAPDRAALEGALADGLEQHESQRTLLMDGAGSPQQQRVMPVEPAVRPRPGIPSSTEQLGQDVAAAAPDRAALEGALADGLEQHESQRTLLMDGAGSPQQWVMPVDPAVRPRPGIPSSTEQLGQDVAAAAPDRTALEGALADGVERHESRCTLLVDGVGGPQQRVLQRIGSSPQRFEQDMAAAAAHHFDLAQEIPLRATLFELGDDEHALLLVIHHTAADGWSVAPLLQDLSQAYAARRQGVAGLPPLGVQYADYTLWQREVLGDESDPAAPSPGRSTTGGRT